MADEGFDPDEFLKEPDVPIITDELRRTEYGPSSPNPTPADLKEYIGNANNPLQTGDVALPPDIANKYGLKAGDPFIYQGKTWHYADTPNPRVGNVIDVYHPAQFDPDEFLKSGKVEVPGSTIKIQTVGTKPISGEFDPDAFLGNAPGEAQPKETPQPKQPFQIAPATPSPVPQVQVNVPNVPQMQIPQASNIPVPQQGGPIRLATNQEYLNRIGNVMPPQMAASPPLQAALNYVKQQVPSSLADVARSYNVPTGFDDPVGIAAFAAPEIGAAKNIFQGALARYQQVKAVEQTPPYSQQRWDAGVGTVLDIAGLAGIAGGIAKGLRGKPVVGVSTKEILPNADLVNQVNAGLSRTEGNVTLYHATPNQFSEFNPEMSTQTGLGGKGVFFNIEPNTGAYGNNVISVNVPKSKLATHAQLEAAAQKHPGISPDLAAQKEGFAGIEGPQPGDYILYNPNEFLTPKGVPIGAANRISAARAKSGLLGSEGAPKPGIGIGYQDSVNEGNVLIDNGADPYQVAADFQKNNLINRQRMGVMRAWLERLQRANAEAQGALEPNPTDPELARRALEAQDAENSFWKAYQPMKTEWANIGTGMQETRGITDSDLLSQSTAEQAMREHLERELKDSEKAAAAKAVKETRAANEGVDVAFKKAINAAANRSVGPVRDLATLKRDLANKLKQLTPC